MDEYIEKEAAITTCKTFWHNSLHNALEAFRQIQVADVHPVRHGRWQSWTQDRPPCKWYSCDYCGFHALSKSNYCPNCGVKMDKEADE